MAQEDRTRVHVWVSGRVQGVFFRQQTRRTAQAHGAGGWVRNLADGRVEAVFEGAAPAVERILEWVRRGPPHAVVEHVEVQHEPPRGDLTFRIMY